jgi:hypothetical protein
MEKYENLPYDPEDETIIKYSNSIKYFMNVINAILHIEIYASIQIYLVFLIYIRILSVLKSMKFLHIFSIILFL